MQDDQQISLKHITTLAFLSIIWGTSFILIKRGLVGYSPVQLASLRVSVAGIGFAPLAIYYLKNIPLNKIWMYCIVGLTGNVIPVFFFALGQTQISSSVAGIVNSMTPIFTIVIGILFYKMVVNKGQVTGVILGFLGGLSLILLGQQSKVESNMWYAGFIVIACVLYALNLNLVKTYFQEVSSIKLTAVSFFLCTIPLIIYILLSDIPQIIQTDIGFKAFSFIALLSIMSTMLALIIFYKLVQQTNAVFASSVAYIIPIVALLWGFIDGEVLGISHVVSMVLILIGVYLIRRN